MLPMENIMSYDDDEDNRKNFRRKKIKNKKEDNKISFQDNDFSYSKIKNQFKQKKRYIEEQDTLEELDDYS